MSRSQRNRFPSKEPSKSSVIKFFLVGGVLLVSPIFIVTYWQNSSCNHEFEELCNGSQLFKSSITFLPYVMIVGGLIIGYNMKRISDSMMSEEERDRGEVDDQDDDDNEALSG